MFLLFLCFYCLSDLNKMCLMSTEVPQFGFIMMLILTLIISIHPLLHLIFPKPTALLPATVVVLRTPYHTTLSTVTSHLPSWSSLPASFSGYFMMCCFPKFLSHLLLFFCFTSTTFMIIFVLHCIFSLELKMSPFKKCVS